MRNAFFKALHELFIADGRVYFITGDLGFKLFDNLTAHDPSRVINAGIREAAMAGIAAGLAKEGMFPFIYSITPFATLRCIEQVKIDICYHRLRVVVVGVGGGFAYGENGPTHHGVDDLGLMSLLPDMTVLAPCDPPEVERCVKATAGLYGPAYLRLGRNGEPVLFPGGTAPDVMKPAVLRDGHDAVIVCTGAVAAAAVEAAGLLDTEGISACVIRVCALKPLDGAALLDLIPGGAPVLAAEEHIGGRALAMPLAELLLRRGGAGPFAAAHIPDEFPALCMSQKKLLEWSGIDAASLVRAVKSIVKGS